MTREELDQLKAKITEAVQTKAKVDDLGGLTEESGQSDKLGYNWTRILLGGVAVKTDYTKQKTKMGTLLHPLTDTAQLIDGAIYKIDGVLQICVNGVLTGYSKDGGTTTDGE